MVSFYNLFPNPFFWMLLREIYKVFFPESFVSGPTAIILFTWKILLSFRVCSQGIRARKEVSVYISVIKYIRLSFHLSSTVILLPTPFYSVMVFFELEDWSALLSYLWQSVSSVVSAGDDDNDLRLRHCIFTQSGLSSNPKAHSILKMRYGFF